MDSTLLAEENGMHCAVSLLRILSGMVALAGRSGAKLTADSIDGLFSFPLQIMQ